MADDNYEYDYNDDASGFHTQSVQPPAQTSASKPMDVATAIKGKVGIKNDKLEIFGKYIDVGGPEVALALKPLIATVLNEVSLRGAATAGRYGTAAASLILPKNHAAKVGKALYFTWLFGLSASDVALGVKKTVQSGFKEMYALRDQAQPLLAANNDLDGSLSKTLTSNFTALAHARAKVYQNGRHNLFGTLAGGIRALPNIAMGIYQHQLDTIRNPRSVFQAKYRPGMSREERMELLAEMKALRAKQHTIPNNAKAALKEEITSLTQNINQANRSGLQEEAQELGAKMESLQAKYKEMPDMVKANHNEEVARLLRKANEKVDDHVFTEGAGVWRKHEKEFVLSPEERKKLSAKAGELRRKPVNSMGPISSLSDEEQHNIVGNLQGMFSDPTFKKRMFHTKGNVESDYYKNIKNLQATPFMAALVGGVMDRHISGKEAPEVAWDKIIDLQGYLERHHDPDRQKINVFIKNIFSQHARDMDKNHSFEGSSYENAMEAITDAVVRYKLHPQAIAEMLDNKKIVIFGSKDTDFGDKEDVKKELGKLLQKYNGKLSEKEIYKSAPFTKETLAATYDKIPQEEKPFFTMLFPAGILERAGVPAEDVKKNRDAGKQHFIDDLTEMTKLIIEKGREDLKAQGVKSKHIDAVEALEQGFRSAESESGGNKYVRENFKDVTKMVRDITASAKKPGEMWKEYVSRKESVSKAQEEEKMAMSGESGGAQMQNAAEELSKMKPYRVSEDENAGYSPQREARSPLEHAKKSVAEEATMSKS